MQKKNEEIYGFKLLVIIIFKATSDPNKYEPLSPKNILAFGKLKRRKETNIIICAVKKNENSISLLSRLINSKTELIIIKLIVKSPLNPSIKFAPLTINKNIKLQKKLKRLYFVTINLKRLNQYLKY